ncbi:MAG: Tn7 transposase TnsA N-terminal domain-containing protein [Solirubrobacteraceae bacterium]
MPQRYADVFRFRWGLDTHFPHLASQTARKFEIPKGTAEEMLSRCLWNVARYAHLYELPAIRELLGDDRGMWAERAWQQAERRWGNEESNFSEAVLLLAAGGLDVPDAHRHARQHMREMGMGRGTRWPKPLTPAEQTDAARAAVDRILEQIIWPPNTTRLRDLSAFATQRPLPSWVPAKSGAFPSAKLGRLVQFDSELELLMLRQFNINSRIIDYQEQPITIPYTVGGEDHEYTPDVIVQLADGGAFVVEAKPLEFLGDFTNWMKWASLARWCAEHGVGVWVGSPQRSLTEHTAIRSDPDKHDFVLAEVAGGAVTEGDYLALERLIGCEQLGLIASAELLDWRAEHRHIGNPAVQDLQAAEQLKRALQQMGVKR